MPLRNKLSALRTRALRAGLFHAIATLALAFAGIAPPAPAQSNRGELRLLVTDASGLGLHSSVVLVSDANQYRASFPTNDSGALVVKLLPFGLYQISAESSGFAPASATVEIRSALPTEFTLHLALAPLNTAVTVTAPETLVDPYAPGAVNRIGSDQIDDRTTSLPGRSLQDLVNSQPGWLYEGNAVLHPRGSEYQTQFVLDGIPLTDNRSPSFAPALDAGDVDSLSIYTAGIPAEYGRKMGGVVEVTTLRDAQAGLHGEAVLSGGSFDTAGAFARLQYGWGKNVLGASASGDMTSHYLNPVVPENFTNTGTSGDFSLNFGRDFSPRDRLTVMVRHGLSRFELPNELVQQQPHTTPLAPVVPGSQLQNAGNFETMGIISYQHIFSPDVLANLRGMVRDDSSDLWSNAYSTPIFATQHNWFREGYFKGSLSIHHKNQEWKLGAESDSIFLHENFSDIITDPTQFDSGTPTTFAFPNNIPSEGVRPDLEQSAFVQDLVRLGNWTLSAGLRWDHYQLVVNQNAVSPRLSLARYFSRADLVVHASYDRVFQTPSFENLLLSSSTAVISLNPNVLRLAVKPSHGNYYEAGITKGFFRRVRLDANYFRRAMDNYADDDQLLSTAISFPIAFDHAVLYGGEAKIEIPRWGALSGYAGYSYIVGNAWFPVTGGLFLGDDALKAGTQLTGHFPDSQDQRNTVRARFQYQLAPRFWIAGGAEYGSGLPFDYQGTEQQAIADYGQQVVDRLNFARGRVRPSLAIDISASADIYRSDRLKLRLQADGENLNSRLNVIDFGGLFSGNAIAPSRSYSLRLAANF